MNKAKAEKRLKRKLTKVKPCPFCGRIPKIEFTTDTKINDRGSFGHYAVRHGCCRPTSPGQTELFFTNNHKKPDFGLWCWMGIHLVNEWNSRVPS